MEPFEIVTYPDKFLRQPTREVENIDETIQKIIDRMAYTMFEAPGVGLAAIQVGIDKSLITFDSNPEKEGDGARELGVLINPKIVSHEGSIVSEREGCLSVPDFRSNVKRYAAVAVEGLDRNGKPVRMERDDFLAVVLQHEIDHLNGILFIDHVSALKRNLYKKKRLKQLKKDGKIT